LQDLIKKPNLNLAEEEKELMRYPHLQEGNNEAVCDISQTAFLMIILCHKTELQIASSVKNTI
jgi:hypothetical protein